MYIQCMISIAHIKHTEITNKYINTQNRNFLEITKPQKKTKNSKKTN